MHVGSPAIRRLRHADPRTNGVPAGSRRQCAELRVVRTVAAEATATGSHRSTASRRVPQAQLGNLNFFAASPSVRPSFARSTAMSPVTAPRNSSRPPPADRVDRFLVVSPIAGVRQVEPVDCRVGASCARGAEVVSVAAEDDDGRLRRFTVDQRRRQQSIAGNLRRPPSSSAASAYRRRWSACGCWRIHPSVLRSIANDASTDPQAQLCCGSNGNDGGGDVEPGRASKTP